MSQVLFRCQNFNFPCKRTKQHACLCASVGLISKFTLARNLNISRGTNEIPSAWLQMRLRMRARVLKIRASSHQRLPSPLTRFVIPHGAEPKGWSQKKGQPGREGLFSPKKNTHTCAYRDTSCKSGRKGRPALGARSVSAFCGQLRAGDFSSRNSHGASAAAAAGWD